MPDISQQSAAAQARGRWFWINLGLLCALAPFATYWFQQHLQLYLTEIVVVGGAFTLWAIVRLVWGVFERFTKFDAWDESRALLSSPAVTRLLVVAAMMFGALWLTTSSLYLELQGGRSAAEYQVDVVRKVDGSPVLKVGALNAGQAVIGTPKFWHWRPDDLQCRIVQPIEYEPRDCSLAAGKSTRINVPGDFQAKEFHLLRIVPVGALYRTLPQDTDSPVTRYDLEIRRGDELVTLSDLRKQTVYTGALEKEMPLIMRLEDANQYERFLETRFRVDGQDRDSASLSAAVLSSTTRTWPAMYLKSGDVLSLQVKWTKIDEGATQAGVLDEFPVTYRVTNDKVQTLWLPKRH